MAANPDDLDPQLVSIVQKMIEEGQSEEDIAAVVQEYNQQKAEQTHYKGPDTFWEGVNESMYPGGEAQQAALQGGLGFLKGATLNLPGSIISGLSSVANAVANPRETIESIPNIPGAIGNALGGMWETTKQAGTDPVAFGEMMGELTGQPAVTAGIVKSAPGATRLAGVPVRGIGNIMQTQTPLSGMMPRLLENRTMRNLERFLGKQIARGGQRMMGGPDFDVRDPWPRPPVRDAEIVPEPFMEGEIIPPVGPTIRELAASSTTQTGYPRASPPTGGVLPATTQTQGIQPSSGYYTPTAYPSGTVPRGLPPITNPVTTQTGYPRASPPTGGTLPQTTQTKGIQPVPTYKSTIPPEAMTGTKELTAPAPTKPANITLTRAFTTPENIDKLVKNGYKFMGMHSDGSMRFSKG